MIRKWRLRFLALMPIGAIGLPGAAFAQGYDPRPALGQIITAFQRCGPPQAYQLLSPQMFQIVAAQTGGSGCYAPIASAGPIVNMQVLQQAQFPIGPLYLVRVSHQTGPVDWFIGFNQQSGRIEYLSFQAVQGSTPTIQTGPSPGASGPGPVAKPDPSPTPKPDPSGQPDECSTFPVMCQ